MKQGTEDTRELAAEALRDVFRHCEELLKEKKNKTHKGHIKDEFAVMSSVALMLTDGRAGVWANRRGTPILPGP